MKKYEKRSNQQTLGQALEHFIKQSGKEELIWEVKAEEAWFAVMGKFFEKYTDRVEVRQRILYVKINSPAMRQELLMGKSKIIANINEEIKKDFLVDAKIY
ncbi:DciA family protein [Chishuiella sp.]|uniref:DciA family protein n=1 Tax=Chishuiella sp. TaxID=1969467 RepID=UPI0028AED7CD|nr:DciA family protein [Chishuiella sp.]